MARMGNPTSVWFCRGCGYRISELPEPRCPECGRGFDPTDSRTFDAGERGRKIRQGRQSLRTVLVALLCLGIGLAAVSWAQWYYQRHAPQWRCLSAQRRCLEFKIPLDTVVFDDDPAESVRLLALAAGDYTRLRPEKRRVRPSQSTGRIMVQGCGHRPEPSYSSTSGGRMAPAARCG